MSRLALRTYAHLAALMAVALGGLVWGLDSRIGWTLAAIFAFNGVMTIHAELGKRCRRVVCKGFESNTICILPHGHAGECGDQYGNRREVEP